MPTTTEPRNVPLPAGATYVDDWQASGTGMPFRFVTLTPRTVTDHPVRVSPQVFQFADGSLADGSDDDAPGIAILDGDSSMEPLNSDQARELAAALLAAAAGLDRLTQG